MVQLDGMSIPESLIEKIEAHIANSYRIIPVRMEDNSIVIATSDPDNLAALDDLKFMLGVDSVRANLTSDESIDRALAQYYEMVEKDAELDSFVSSFEDEELASGDLIKVPSASLTLVTLRVST